MKNALLETSGMIVVVLRGFSLQMSVCKLISLGESDGIHYITIKLWIE